MWSLQFLVSCGVSLSSRIHLFVFKLPAAAYSNLVNTKLAVSATSGGANTGGKTVHADMLKVQAILFLCKSQRSVASFTRHLIYYHKSLVLWRPPASLFFTLLIKEWTNLTSFLRRPVYRQESPVLFSDWGDLGISQWFLICVHWRPHYTLAPYLCRLYLGSIWWKSFVSVWEVFCGFRGCADCLYMF